MSYDPIDYCPVCDGQIYSTETAHTWHDDDCMQVRTSGLGFVDCTCDGLRECHADCCPTCAILGAADDFDRIFGRPTP